jgi:hypothetical protein
MNKPSLKDMLRNLLATYELKCIEAEALKSILINCSHAYTQDTWKQDLDKLLHDPEIIKSAHAAFLPIYAQVDAANDEAAVIALLSAFPIAGKVN